MKILNENSKVYLVLSIIILLSILIRIVALEADSDVRMSGDSGFILDEGLYSLSAVNLTKYQNFNPNPNNNLLIAIDSPIYTYMEYLSLKLFGLKIWSLRLPSVIYSTITMLILFLLIQKIYGNMEALLSTFLFSFNYQYFQYSRVALLEPLITLFLVSSIYYAILHYDDKRKILLSGLFFGLAFITKGSVLFYLPAIFLSFYIGNNDKPFLKGNYKNLILFSFGIVIISVLNSVYVNILENFIVLNTELKRVNLIDLFAFYLELNNPWDWIKTLSQFIISRFTITMPFCFLVACAYSIHFIITLKKNFTDKQRTELLLIASIFITIFGLSLFDYSPNRYRVPMVVPISILSAISISHLIKNVGSSIDIKCNSLAVVTLNFFFLLIFFRVFRVLSISAGIDLTNLSNLIISIVLAFIFSKIILRFLDNIYTFVFYYKNYLSITLLTLILINLSANYIYWNINLKNSIRDWNIFTNEHLSNANIGGQYAPILTLTSKNIAIPFYTDGSMWQNNLSNYKQLNLSHFLDPVNQERRDTFEAINKIENNFLDNGGLVFEKQVGNELVSLYRINLRQTHK